MTMSESWIVVAVAAVLGFLVGSINPATIIARIRHADLRQGSGNPGATNAGRVLGLRWGVAVGLLDVLKGLLPTLLALWQFWHWMRAAVTMESLTVTLVVALEPVSRVSRNW